MPKKDVKDLEVVKSFKRKPTDTKFRQQQMASCQPELSPGYILPVFFIIGLAFIPLGIWFLVSSDSVQESSYDYTYCASTKETSKTCAKLLKNDKVAQDNCTCQFTITLSQTFQGKVFVYYALTNFYQNHRQYIQSRDDLQLYGVILRPNALSENCKPFRKKGEKGIAPCGVIANSLFNDTFAMELQRDEDMLPVKIIKTDIAWTSDRTVKFKNPSDWQSEHYDKPPNWPTAVWNRSSEAGHGYLNEDFLVWMRTAALPSFRKLYGRVDHSVAAFQGGLPAGTYKVTVNYNFPVMSYLGTKSLVLSTTNWMGGKNPFLGIAYIIAGSICFIVSCFLLAAHLKWGINLTQEMGLSGL